MTEDVPVANAGPDQVIECPDHPVTLCGSASGGTAPYTYEWSPGGETTEDITVSTPGTYTLTVTGAGGCSASDSAVVTEGPEKKIWFTTVPTSSTVWVAGTSPRYYYSTENLRGCPVSNEPIGHYYSTDGGTTWVDWGIGCNDGTDKWSIPGNIDSDECLLRLVALNCPSVEAISPMFTIQQPISVDAGPDKELNCESPSATLSASATGEREPYSYEWSPGGETTEDITVSTPGTYTATVTGANGYSASDSVVVTQGVVALELIVQSANDYTCEDPCCRFSFEIVGGEPRFTVKISKDGELLRNHMTNGRGGSFTHCDDGGGTYRFDLTDGTGCPSVTVYAEVPDETTPPVVDVGPDVELICPTGEVLLAGDVSGGSPPYSYLWTPGGQAVPEITVSEPGTYTLTVTGTDGCHSSDSAEVLDRRGQLTAAVVDVATAEDTPVSARLPWETSSGGAVLELLRFPEHGQVEFQPQNVIYAPETNWHGKDSFLCAVGTGPNCTTELEINVDVSSVNDPPNTEDDWVIANVGVPVEVDVLRNDSDVDGDLLLVSRIASTDFAEVTHDGRTISITPNSSAGESLTLTYWAEDAAGATSVGRVVVEIVGADGSPSAANQPPLAAVNGQAMSGACDPRTVNLSWEAGDPDGDLVEYDVSIFTEDEVIHRTHLVSSESRLSVEVTVPPGAPYSWSVSVQDEHGRVPSSAPALWSFEAPKLELDGELSLIGISGGGSSPESSALVDVEVTNTGNIEHAYYVVAYDLSGVQVGRIKAPTLCPGETTVVCVPRMGSSEGGDLQPLLIALWSDWDSASNQGVAPRLDTLETTGTDNYASESSPEITLLSPAAGQPDLPWNFVTLSWNLNGIDSKNVMTVVELMRIGSNAPCQIYLPATETSYTVGPEILEPASAYRWSVALLVNLPQWDYLLDPVIGESTEVARSSTQEFSTISETAYVGTGRSYDNSLEGLASLYVTFNDLLNNPAVHAYPQSTAEFILDMSANIQAEWLLGFGARFALSQALGHLTGLLSTEVSAATSLLGPISATNSLFGIEDIKGVRDALSAQAEAVRGTTADVALLAYEPRQENRENLVKTVVWRVSDLWSDLPFSREPTDLDDVLRPGEIPGQRDMVPVDGWTRRVYRYLYFASSGLREVADAYYVAISRAPERYDVFDLVSLTRADEYSVRLGAAQFEAKLEEAIAECRDILEAAIEERPRDKPDLTIGLIGRPRCVVPDQGEYVLTGVVENQGYAVAEGVRIALWVSEDESEGYSRILKVPVETARLDGRPGSRVEVDEVVQFEVVAALPLPNPESIAWVYLEVDPEREIPEMSDMNNESRRVPVISTGPDLQVHTRGDWSELDRILGTVSVPIEVENAGSQTARSVTVAVTATLPDQEGEKIGISTMSLSSIRSDGEAGVDLEPGVTKCLFPIEYHWFATSSDLQLLFEIDEDDLVIETDETNNKSIPAIARVRLEELQAAPMVSEDFLDFGLERTSLTLTIANLGLWEMPWNISGQENSPWLSLTSSDGLAVVGGRLDGGQRAELTLRVDRTLLTTSSIFLPLTVEAADELHEVTLFVENWQPTAKLEVSPSRVELLSESESAVIQILNKGGATLDWRAEPYYFGSWIEIEPSFGEVPPGGSAVVTIATSPDLLAKGENHTGFTISSNGGEASVAVTASGPLLAVQPGSIAFGTALEAPESLSLTNDGGASLKWKAYASNFLSWLSVSPDEGTLLPGEQVELDLAVAPDRLPSGSGNQETLRIRTSGGDADIAASADGAVLSVHPSHLDFSDSTAQVLTVANQGGGALRWEIAPSHFGSWAVVEPDTGELHAGESKDVRVRVKPDELSESAAAEVFLAVESNAGTEAIPVVVAATGTNVPPVMHRVPEGLTHVWGSTDGYSSDSQAGGESVRLAVRVEDLDGNLDRIVWENDAGWETFSVPISGFAVDFNFVQTFYRVGDGYTLKGTAYDTEGASASLTWDMTISKYRHDPTDPEAWVISPAEYSDHGSRKTIQAQPGQTVTFLVGATDINGDLSHVEWSAYGADYAGTSETFLLRSCGESCLHAWSHTFDSGWGSVKVYAQVFDSTGRDTTVHWDVQLPEEPRPSQVSFKGPCPSGLILSTAETDSTQSRGLDAAEPPIVMLFDKDEPPRLGPGDFVATAILDPSDRVFLAGTSSLVAICEQGMFTKSYVELNTPGTWTIYATTWVDGEQYRYTWYVEVE